MEKRTYEGYPEVFPTYNTLIPSREHLAAMYVQAMLPAMIQEHGIGTSANLYMHRIVQLAYTIADETLLVASERA